MSDEAGSGYFDEWLQAELRRLDDAIADTRRSADARYASQQDALAAARRDLDRRVEALNEFRAQLADQQSSLLTRREYEAKHDSLSSEVDSLRDVASAGAGRRSATIATLAAVTSLFVLLLGLLLRGGLSSNDVSNQIQRESPWAVDRPLVEKRLDALEKENERLNVRLAQIEQLDRFFCATRTKAKLPGC